MCLDRASRFQVSVVPINQPLTLTPRRWVRGRAPWRSGRMSWQHAIQFSTDICFCPNLQKLMRKVQTCCRPAVGAWGFFPLFWFSCRVYCWSWNGLHPKCKLHLLITIYILYYLYYIYCVFCLPHFDMLHAHLFHTGLVSPSRANAMISWT